MKCDFVLGLLIKNKLNGTVIKTINYMSSKQLHWKIYADEWNMFRIAVP